MQMGSATPCSNYLFFIPLLIIFSLPSSASSLSFDYPTLGNSVQQDFRTLGNTSTFPTYVELTISGNDPRQSVGRLLYGQQLSLWNLSTQEAASFNCFFQFQILEDIDSAVPGDGLAFVLLNPSSSNILDNSDGSWLGLFNESTDGTSSAGVIAIEFDTFKNDFDPNDNHIGIDINTIISEITESNLEFYLANSTSVFCWVDYSSSQTLLEVYATDLSNTKPSFPLLSYNINLALYLEESILIGFSASTGIDFEYHRMLSWSFNSTTIGITTSTPQSPPATRSSPQSPPATMSSPQSPPTNTMPPIGDIPIITEKESNVGLFAGLGAGVFVILVIILVLLGLFMRRRRQGQQHNA